MFSLAILNASQVVFLLLSLVLACLILAAVNMGRKRKAQIKINKRKEDEELIWVEQNKKIRHPRSMDLSKAVIANVDLTRATVQRCDHLSDDSTTTSDD